jgi:hypothetical protein
MSALGQTANSGQISDVSLQIGEQMPGAFAALARKYQVPGARFAIYHGDLTNIGAAFGCRAADNSFLCNEFVMGDRRCHLSCRVLSPMS